MATDWCPFANKRAIVESNYASGRGGQKVKAIVLHIAEGSLAGTFAEFNTPNKLKSAHFCVGKDGTIDQYVSINNTAFANGLAWKNNQWFTGSGVPVNPSWRDIISGVNPNAYTVSIEHEGKFQETWTPEMYDANNRLVFWLSEQLELTLTPNRTLIGHWEINPVDKQNCPGPNVEYARMATDVAAITAAKKLTWMPINTEAALYKFAQEENLGYPQTDEFKLNASGATYIAQVFNLGIVYVKEGNWGNVKWAMKQ